MPDRLRSDAPQECCRECGIGEGTGIALSASGPMRLCLAIGLLVAILPLPAFAQTSTEDGVRALVRGDYATAARILSPLAETSADADPTAQFFMGLLYAAGKGVRMDPMRASSL